MKMYLFCVLDTTVFFIVVCSCLRRARCHIDLIDRKLILTQKGLNSLPPPEGR